jgi:hypothetical protein
MLWAPPVKVSEHPQCHDHRDAIHRNGQQIQRRPAANVFEEVGEQIQDADQGQKTKEPFTV